MKKLISFHTNGKGRSPEIERKLAAKLEKEGFTVTRNYDHNAELLVCIGGDGTFFDAIHKFNYPNVPIIGINTGHLGFFQDVLPEKLDAFINDYLNGNYKFQTLSLIRTRVKTKTHAFEHLSLNEITIRSTNFRSIHLNIFIDDKLVECYNGDGLVISTPTGSTAFNYSLRGSIVDPRLDLIQITPIAPMNSIAYKTLSSSILIPSESSLKFVPAMERDCNLCVVRDGYNHECTDITDLEIDYSDKKVRLIRSVDFDFWSKVSDKLL